MSMKGVQLFNCTHQVNTAHFVPFPPLLLCWEGTCSPDLWGMMQSPNVCQHRFPKKVLLNQHDSLHTVVLNQGGPMQYSRDTWRHFCLSHCKVSTTGTNRRPLDTLCAHMGPHDKELSDQSVTHTTTEKLLYNTEKLNFFRIIKQFPFQGKTQIKATGGCDKQPGWGLTGGPLGSC